jgi:hypothetical protein
MVVTILVVADLHVRGLPSLTVTHFSVSGPQRVKTALERKLHELDHTILLRWSENTCILEKPVDLHRLLSWIEEEAGKLQHLSYSIYKGGPRSYTKYVFG